MVWTTNPIMEWKDPRASGDPSLPNRTDTPGQWIKVTDHNRSPLSISYERIENKQRMANGTLRRYVITKKRTWSASWENLPDKKISLLANGESGLWMEKFHNDVDGSFLVRFRQGSDDGVSLPTTKDGIKVVEVMITDFSKEITKRGKEMDLWSLDITLEEV